MTEQSSILRNEVLGESGIAEKIQRMSAGILERIPPGPVAFVGIHSRGVVLAERMYNLATEHRQDIQKGTLDISLYRDDLDNLGSIPAIKGSDIGFVVEGAHIILFDDVLFTGRTIRAAIDELIDFGRPSKIELAVLIDRGNRELPICADYVGHLLNTTRDEHVSVCFKEKDGEEGVYLLIRPPE